MKVFRLSKKNWSGLLSGKGAAIKGGRWNSQGTEIIYCAASRSLAMAELAVHFTLATLPPDYMMVSINIPENISTLEIEEKDLPEGWNSFPHIEATRRIGDDFINENKCCLLKIPSAVTKGDFNILINPFHPEFNKIEILTEEPFPFDRRIFK